MRYLLTLVIILTLVGCTTSSTNPVVLADGDEDRLREIQSELLPKAYSEQDTVLLDQLLHQDFQLIDDNGDSYGKVDEMKYVGEYGPSYSEFTYDVSTIALFENGVAIVTGTGTMKGTDDGGAYITTYKSTTALIKDSGDWKAINSHVSGVKEERFQLAPKNE